MNRQFYEFWGQAFLNLARGQQQIEEVTALMNKGWAGFGELGDLFRRSYGLPPSEKRSDDSETTQWQDAVRQFQQSFSQFAAQWGWVTQTEHQQIIEKCAALEKKVQDQETTIRQLRDLLTQEGRGHSALFQHLQQSLKEQNEQFHALMESMRDHLKDAS